MHQAAKRVATEIATNLSDEELIPSNDRGGSPVKRNISELRQKIKSARLEKLMARQLESELSIDHIEIEEPQELDFELDENFDISLDSEPSESPSAGNFAEEAALTSHSTLQSRNIYLQQSKRSCGEMVEKIKTSSQVLSNLAGYASGLERYLNTIERELITLERSEKKVLVLEETNDKMRLELHETQAVIKKQSKQIELLETMHKSSLNSNEKANNEIARLQNSLRKKDREINGLEATISEAEQSRNGLKSDYNKLANELGHTSQSLTNSREKLRIKDIELTKHLADINTITAENEQNLDKLADVQAKYDELNRRSLEQQNQHYTKIHTLENLVRELKQNVETNNREKAELSVELNAANNLLVLHEEMITALSPEDDD